ncbi:hypothetical protein [Burkholderia ubonensis]|uniref:hypothetical protein n=1 Tax=Burkholderia ubonensis TaxID=101571 RepID=UPI0012FCB422|nr:hypothetical protein [Burkholderia ubonensis]
MNLQQGLGNPGGMPWNLAEEEDGGPGGVRTRDQSIMSLLVEFQPLKNQTFTRAKLLFLLR